MHQWALVWVFFAVVAQGACLCENGNCDVNGTTCTSCKNSNYTLVPDLNSTTFKCIGFCDVQPDICELTAAATLLPGGLYTHTDNFSYGLDCFSIFPDGRCLTCNPVPVTVPCFSRNCQAQPYCPPGFGFENGFADLECEKGGGDWPFPVNGTFTHASCSRSCVLYGFSSTSPKNCTRCAPGYYGSSCDECPAMVNSAPCAGHGTCDEHSGICACDSGYAGYGCQYTRSATCHGHGNPSQDNSTTSFSCICDKGWDTATNCSTCNASAGWLAVNDTCAYCAPDNSTCNFHGVCGNPANMNACMCDLGYAGESCELCDAFHYRPNGTNVTFPCTHCMAPTTCSGHGKCNTTDGSCICTSPFTGPNCASCPPGFWGRFCETPCPGLVNGSIGCSGQGTCDAGINGTGVCTCAPGYGGSGCQFSPANACNGHGSALASESDVVRCQCDTGFAPPNCRSCLPDYYGPNCTRCGEDTCGGVGVFLGTGAKGRCQLNGTCLCDAAYTGTNCELCAAGRYDYPRCVPCDASTCSNHGTCMTDGSCNCSVGWGGPLCSDCAPGYFGSSCSVCQCGGNGRCAGGVGGSGACTCNSPFRGTQCQDPTIVMAMPLTAPTAGTSLRLIGYYLTGTPTVTVGGRTNNRTCTSAATSASSACTGCTEVTCTLGPTDPNVNGQAAIFFSNGVGSATFSYGFQPPIITGISYTGVANTTGLTVTLTGSNFGEYASVTWGAQAAVPLTCTHTQIVFTAPAGSGAVPVFVTVGGRASSAYTFVYAAPYVSTATSPQTSTAGSGSLTVSGANFGTVTGNVVVMVGSQNCGVATVNQGQIVCTLPASHGIQPVTVTVSGIAGSSSTTFAYGAPTILNVSGCTDAGVATTACSQSATTPITINGANFGVSSAAQGTSGALTVTVGGVPCGTVSVDISHTRLSCVLPVGGFGTGVPVVVSRTQFAGVVQSATANLLSYQGPTITPFTLNVSSSTVTNTSVYAVTVPNTLGGQLVLITGTGFGVVPANVAVRFFASGDPNKASLGASPYTNCAVNSVTDVLINCTLGSGVGRNLVFQVRVSGLYSGYSKDVLNHPLHTAATINGLSSVTVTSSNFTITIVGTNFGGSAFLNQLAVTYGPAGDKSRYQCVPLMSTTDGSIQCLYGGGSLSGMQLRITIGAFDSATAVDPALNISGAVSPNITSIVLPSACVGNLCPTDARAKGLLLTINVANLAGVPVVRLGPVDCPEIQLVSASQITCRLPDYSGKSYPVVLSQSVLYSAQSFTVSYQDPVISTVTGSCIDGNGTFACRGGETITVTGSNFGPATGLMLLVQGVPCGGLTKLSEGSLTCALPTLWARTPSAITLVQQSGDVSNVLTLSLYAGCNPGNFYDFTLDACSPCPAGTYQTLNGQSACLPCQSGTYSSSGRSTCTACPPGQFSSQRATGCQNATIGTSCAYPGMPSCPSCPAGSYSNVEGASACTLCLAVKGEYSTGVGLTSCSVCTAGTFPTQDGQTFCGTCQPGKYTFLNTNQGYTTCNSCGVGTFYNASLLPAVPCQNCSIGRFTSAPGASECVPCQQGSYGVISGASACMACAPGKASNALGALNCVDCVAGKYVGVLGAATCLDCPVNTWSTLVGNTAGCLTCPAGQETVDTGRTTCQLCPVGKAIPGGGKRCAFCAPGKFANATGMAQCYSAPRDYSTADSMGSTFATACPVGTEARAVGSVSCQDCPVGSFNNRSGSGDGCMACPPGTFTDTTRATACRACTPGKYQRLWGQESCTLCDAGTFGTASGAISSTVCTACSAGTYQSISGATGCVACPAGKRAYLSKSSACTTCPPGTQFDAASPAFCSRCPVGRVRTGMDPADDGMCTTCPPGKYANASGLSVCLDCIPAYYCPANTINPIRCPTGYVTDKLNSVTCDPCPAGKYGTTQGQVCRNCIPGSYQDKIGQSACKDCTITGTGNAYFGAPDNGEAEDRTSCRITPNGYKLVGRYWQLCPPGQDSRADRAHTSCSNCAYGTYSNGSSPNGCLACPAGKAQSVTGQPSCDDCELGRYAPPPARATGPTQCYACEAGTFASSPGVSSCTACPPGTYSVPALASSGGVGDGPGIVSCSACSVGKSAEGPGASFCGDCKPGTYQDRIARPTCNPCPAGNVTALYASSSCSPCPPLFVASNNNTICTQCPEGQHWDKVAAICEGCPPGYDLGSATKDTCTACEMGRARSGDATICEACAPGSFAGQTGQSACQVCAPGTAQSSSGSPACLVCALGTYAPGNATECKECELGRFGPAADTLRANCTLCPAGRATDVNGTTGNCTACDAGRWAGSVGQSRCDACDAGRYNPINGSYAPCTECLPGKSALGGQSTCLDCATNRIAFYSGQSACVDCTFGVPSNEANTVCLCPSGFYVDPALPLGPNASVTCFPCPTGADCSGEGRLNCREDTRVCQEQGIQTRSGYWRGAGMNFYRCLLPEHCCAGNGTVNCCNQNRGGFLCASCLPGTSANSILGDCKPCPDPKEALVITIVIVVVIFIAAVILYVILLRADSALIRAMEEADKKAIEWDLWKNSLHIETRKMFAENLKNTAVEKPESKDDPLAFPSLSGKMPDVNYQNYTYKIKIVIGFLQINSSAALQLKVPWPRVYQNFINAFSIVNLDFAPWQSVACVNPYTFYDKYLALTILPITAFLFICGAFMLFVRIWRQILVTRKEAVGDTAGAKDEREIRERKITRVVRKFWKLALFTIFLAFPGVCSRTLSFFVCLQNDNAYYLYTDVSVRCYDELWYSYLGWAVTCIFLYPVAIPLGFLAVLLYFRSRFDEPGVKLQTGFLYDAYVPGIWWFEMLDIAHKLFMTSILTFVDRFSQMPVGLAVLGLYLIAILVVKPYVRSTDDLLHLTCQMELMLLCLVGYRLMNQSIEPLAEFGSEGIADFTGVLLIILTVLVLLIFVIFAVKALRTLVFSWLAKRRNMLLTGTTGKLNRSSASHLGEGSGDSNSADDDFPDRRPTQLDFTGDLAQHMSPLFQLKSQPPGGDQSVRRGRGDTVVLPPPSEPYPERAGENKEEDPSVPAAALENSSPKSPKAKSPKAAKTSSSPKAASSPKAGGAVSSASSSAASPSSSSPPASPKVEAVPSPSPNVEEVSLKVEEPSAEVSAALNAESSPRGPSLTLY